MSEIFINKKVKLIILFGLIGGVSIWIYEYAIPVILFFIFMWFAQNKLFFKTKHFFQFILSFFIGVLPLIIYNLTHDFQNIKHTLSGTFLHSIACKFDLIPKQVSFEGRIVNHCDILTLFEIRI